MIKEGPIVSCDGFEFMIRRAKLVADSYWICTVDVHFSEGFYKKGAILKVTRVDDKHVRFFSVKPLSDVRDHSGQEQFLLLCRPLEKSSTKRITWEVFQEVTVEVPENLGSNAIAIVQSETMKKEFPGFFCGEWKEET